ncbi:MAG: phosphonate C-P lyase system protein PhnG [Caldimicrobium sp.]|nr:phosphonate C-P lyase system protein PhnG [Caldimicrobium sp.]MCX7874244.1 phosphonate C-P lyase system protein PhnG [Caldimicrobium sp.]MDW8094773.1 phosphonate C-P lyase system protein PhnG [Caldimicrobium sp.]
MEKSEIGILISRADRKVIRRFRALIEKEPIKVIKEPTAGSIMVTAKDFLDVAFCLGEVLVTEALVEYEDTKGYGLIIGDEPEKALVLAFIDAVYKSKNESLKKKLETILLKTKTTIEEKDKLERAVISKTRVNFEIMAKR